MIDTLNVKAFSSKQEAMDWMVAEVDDFYIDNERFAYLDDVIAMKEYGRILDEGCCGFFDEEIVVCGKPAKIGCNFGH